MSTPNDLLIIGAGNLGRLIASAWRDAHPSATIQGETRTETSHEALAAAGATPALAGSSSAQFPYVVFCAPPSQSDDYPGAAADAAKRVLAGGRFLFTSSGSVHGREAKLINEDTPVVTEGRAVVLARAEHNVLAVPEGNVLRLAGLYTRERGAHVFWLKKGAISGAPNVLINLLHYEDAAAAVVAVLSVRMENVNRRTFLACSDRSITRRGICEAALKHPKYSQMSVPEYDKEQAEEPRVYNASLTRELTGWKPKYSSFEEFMEKDAQNYIEEAVASR